MRRGVAPDFFVDFFVPPQKNLPPSCFRSSLKINKQKLSINKHLRVPLERSRRVPLQASSGHAKEKNYKKRKRREAERRGRGRSFFFLLKILPPAFPHFFSVLFSFPPSWPLRQSCPVPACAQASPDPTRAASYAYLVSVLQQRRAEASRRKRNRSVFEDGRRRRRAAPSPTRERRRELLLPAPCCRLLTAVSTALPAVAAAPRPPLPRRGSSSSSSSCCCCCAPSRS